MIPAGYLAKRITTNPEWLAASGVEDIYSVSDDISVDFADYIDYWKHNDWWLFDSPDIIRQVAQDHVIHLEGTRLFYYEVHEFQFLEKERRWESIAPEPLFKTKVVPPSAMCLEGYDVVTFFCGSSPECSPLSCNYLAKEIKTNRHCLLSSLEEARQLLEQGKFDNSEPGPFRIFAVYSVEWP